MNLKKSSYGTVYGEQSNTIVRDPSTKSRCKVMALAIVAIMILVSLLPMVPTVSAVSQQFTQNYRNDTDVNILPEGWPWTTVKSDINVGLDVTVTRVDVIINIVHGRRGDCIVGVRAPDGTFQSLWNNPGDNTPNLYLDVNDLANFRGKAGLGTWSLEAYDWWGNAITGKIDYWELLIYYDLDVSISSPASGASISGTYTVKANVANAANIELWMDGSYVSDMVLNGGSGLYEYALDTTGYADGMHNMQVIAEDIFGNRLADLIGVKVDNYDITSNIVAPLDGATISGIITVWQNVPSYATIGVLAVDGVVLSTDSTLQTFSGLFYFSFSLDTRNYADGNHALSATAYDPDGNFAVDTNTNDFDNYAISCSIADPLNGVSISGTYIVKADVPVTAVKGELYVDGSLAGTDTTRDGFGQYTFTLDTTLYTDGGHTLKVIAYNVLGDAATDVKVVRFDNWAITANIVSPTTGTIVSGTVTVMTLVPSYATEGRLYVNGNLYQTTSTVQFGAWFLFNWDTTSVTDGIVTIRAEVDDPDGNTAADSETPTVNNYAISVAITAPSNGATISGNYIVKATVPIYSTRGELYIDDVLSGIDLARDVNGQYTYNIDTTLYSDGNHNFRVVVFDPDGASAVDVVSATVDNYAISVNIQTPINGGTVSGMVTVRAQTQSYALKGMLYIDGNYIAQDTTLDGSNRFSFVFDSTNYADASHSISVRVYDPDGSWSSDTINVKIDNWNIQVTITDPIDGSTVSGTVTVRATVPSYAKHGDLIIDDIFVASDTTISGGEYTFSLNTKDYTDGNHIVRVVAYDPDNNFAVDTINIDVDNYDISVSFIWPVGGTSISGNSYNVFVSTDNYATKGELYIDGRIVQTRTSFIFSNWYQFTIDTTAFSDGFHTLSVRTYDPDGSFAQDSISVTVDNYKLSVSITSPTDGSTVSGIVSVQANVQDYAQLGECYLDDELIDTDTTVSGGRFDFSIDTSYFRDSGHVIKVIAYDPENTASVDSVSVVFDNWDITVNIFSPIDGSTVSGSINILATVPAYATKGDLYMDGELFSTDTSVTSNRFQFAVDTTGFSDGLHTYKVMAYDPDGSYVADTITLEHGNWDLDVTINSPNANAVVSGNIQVSAGVDDTANLAKISVDSLLVDTSTASRSSGQTYSFNVDTRGFTDGNHLIRVEASYSVSGESSYDTIPITFDNTAPSLTSLSIIYLNGLTAVRKSGDKVVVIATADDSTSGVNLVMLDATNIGGGSSLSMFDDGNHNDGESGDGVYGSDPIDVQGSMGYHRTFVTASDQVGNQITKAISVAIDDHDPLVTNTYIVYPVGQSAAKLADNLRVIANVVDTTVFVDIVLMIDTSGSMAGTPISDAKKAAKSFVDQIDVNDRSALYSFDNPQGPGGNSPKQEIGFTKNKVNVKNKIDGLAANDWTPLYDTIKASITYAKTSNNLPVVIALTDGVDCLGVDFSRNCNKFSTATLDDVSNASIPIFTIGLGKSTDINETALKTIATTSNGGAYYYAPDSDDLKDIYNAIAAKVEDLEVGGISSVVADLSAIGSGSRNMMYDDGNHGEGAMGDNVYGSNLIKAASALTNSFDYFVNATDVGGNKDSGKGKVLIDNTLPQVSKVDPVYQPNEWWAADGDDIRFTAIVNDTGNVGGITTVTLDATSIGGSSAVPMRDDGSGGDSTAGDGVYTSNQVTISTGLRTGIFEITVSALDIAANPSSAKGNIYIDNYRPMKFNLIDPGDGDYIEGRHTFRATSNNIDAINKLEINLMNQWYTMAYNAMSSYYELQFDTTAYSDGSYIAVLQVTDIAGKKSVWSQNQAFFIDNTPPTLLVNSPTEGSIVQGQVLINTTGTYDTYLSAVEYKIDDLSWIPVSEPWNTTDVVDGEHTIEVRAFDAIGHGSFRTIHVIVDNGNPEGYFVNPSNGEFLEGVVTIQIKATDLVQIGTVRLSGDIQSPMIYNAISGYYELDVDTGQMDDGTYSISAKVIDIADHEFTVQGLTFNVDNNEPILSMITPINGESLSETVPVKINVTDGPFDPVTVEWRIDKGPWRSMTNMTDVWNTTAYVDGSHDLNFRTTDNLDRLVQTSIMVTVDNTAPTIELTSPIDGQFIDGRYLFKMHSYDKVGVDRVLVDIEGVTNYTLLNTASSSYFEIEIDTNNIQDGSYRTTVTSIDLSGFSTTTSPITINIDNNAPELMINRPINGEYIYGRNFTVSGLAKDVFLTNLEYSVDGFGSRGINESLDTTYLSEGEHTIEVMAKDDAGHVTSKVVNVIVDNQGPSLNPVSPQKGESISGSYTFRVRADDANGIDNVELTVGNTTLYMFQNTLTGYFEVSWDSTLDKDGQSLYIFTATDMSGKESNLTIGANIDNSPPDITVLGPSEKAKDVVKFKVQVTDPSGIDRVLIRIGGGEWRDMRHEGDEYVYRWRTSEEDNGDQPYDIKVIDKLDNVDIYAYNLVVDNPSSKLDLSLLWIALLIVLICGFVGIALMSRRPGSRSSARERAYRRRFEEEGPDTTMGMPIPPRKIKGAASAGSIKQIGTAQHRAAMRKIESDDIVVGRPEKEEVEFMPMDNVHGMEQGSMVVAPLNTLDRGDDDVTFHEDDASFDDDEVSFHDEDEVSFHEDDASFDDDEVSFHDEDEVSFHEDDASFGDDEVSFNDDDVEFMDDDDDVQFIDDKPPIQTPRIPVAQRRMPSIPLTARKAQAKLAPGPPVRSSPEKVSLSAMKGIDDLLGDRRGPSRSVNRPAVSAPKIRPRSKEIKSDDPLGDLIGGI